jgi:hypothetical protein
LPPWARPARAPPSLHLRLSQAAQLRRSLLYLLHPLAEPIDRRWGRIRYFRRRRHERDVARVELIMVRVARVPLIPPFLLR